MDLSAHEGEIPIPISSTYVGQSHGHSLIHDTTPQLHHHYQQHHHNNSNGPPPPPPLPPPPLSTPTTDNSIKKGANVVVVKYKECLKNHAAAIGGNATDGCGEFMPSGEEGSLEALKCSACGCHRNFHRKEIEGDHINNNTSSCDYSHYHHHIKGGGRKLIGGHKGVLISTGPDAAFGYNNSSGNNNSSLMIPRPTPHSMIMPIGAAAIQTSESDDLEGGGYPRPPMTKKRFRTKFSAEQKEKMLAFAERAGWKLQKQEESVVQQFCEEIGVKRRVLKVWMHNNKHNLAKKAAASLLQPSSLNERMDE